MTLMNAMLYLLQPDMKGQLSAIARILGPRGLMPNPKLGTLVEDVAGAVRTLKQGRIEFRCGHALPRRTGESQQPCVESMLHLKPWANS
jgi:ribosomal protein L1